MVRPRDWTKEARRPMTMPIGIEMLASPSSTVMKAVGSGTECSVNEHVAG